MNIENEVNKARIEFHANTGMPLQKVLLNEIKTWQQSNARDLMYQGDAYYRGEMDILNKRRTVTDENGLEITAKGVSNQKLEHQFIKKLVRQKVSYLMSEQFEIETDYDDYTEILNDIFDAGVFKTMKNVMTHSINKGIAWLYLYLENDKLKFKIMDSKELIPLWKDSEKTRLDGVIRVYKIEEYTGDKLNVVTKVEFYTVDRVHRFILDGSSLIEDVEANSRLGNQYINVETGEGIKALNWGKVPLVYFKYNDLMQPLIAMVKSLIDDYNIQTSLNADLILDTPNSVIHVRNYDGQNPAEFRKNLNTWGVGFTSEDGNMEILPNQINTEAYEKHMDRLRKDIFEFGGGVDTSLDTFGNSPSGIALSILYQDLDLDCNEIETEFHASLEYLMYFVNIYILDVLGGSDFREERARFIFKRNRLNNDTEIIKSLNESIKHGTLSLETITQRHPLASDYELKRLEEENQMLDDELVDYINSTKLVGDDNEEE